MLSAGIEPTRPGLQPGALPTELRELGTASQIRTDTDEGLNLVPLPIGL